MSAMHFGSGWLALCISDAAKRTKALALCGIAIILLVCGLLGFSYSASGPGDSVSDTGNFADASTKSTPADSRSFALTHTPVNSTPTTVKFTLGLSDVTSYSADVGQDYH